MASALIGGLVKAGRPAAAIIVVEPFERSATSWRRPSAWRRARGR
jgi:pyrroline-5-carboxylate reductase